MHANDGFDKPRVLSQPPAELTRERLRRVGEGIGKVVYASEHWVVKRERSPSEVMSLIAVWKVLRKCERVFPWGVGERLLARPAGQIRMLRVLMQPVVLAAPKSLWFMRHVGEVLHVYRSRDTEGETLAREYLTGTDLVPRRVTFPPVRVRVGGWPGWLTVSEAVERAEETLFDRVTKLAAAGRYDEIEVWLDRLLERRRAAWQRGIFSVDPHLKNYGIAGGRIVLLDAGGLTNKWEHIEARLDHEAHMRQPHVRFGLGPVLRTRPDIAERFDERWRSSVNLDEVRRHWPADLVA